MLVKANVIQPGEKAKKERCFEDYKSQMLYIEGMKAVLGEGYDPRHAERPFGKNGKYKPTNKFKNEANPDGTYVYMNSLVPYCLILTSYFCLVCRSFDKFFDYPVPTPCTRCCKDNVSTYEGERNCAPPEKSSSQ